MLLSVPSVDSWPAKFFGPRWPEWKPENRYYFDRETIQLLLLRCGYRHNLVLPDRRPIQYPKRNPGFQAREVTFLHETVGPLRDREEPSQILGTPKNVK